jgi:hypothetical protein
MKSNYFTTSDGQEFYTDTNAINHARTLKDKTVIPPGEDIAEIEVFGSAAEQSAKDGADESGKEEAGEEETPKVNISKFTKPQLIAFAADNELTIDETATNAVIIAAIEAQLIEKKPA